MVVVLTTITNITNTGRGLMRVWQLNELGDPGERLAIVEVDEPEPRAGQVLVETEAVGLAFPDVLSCRGEYQVPTQLPFTPGGESAGRIVGVGEGVDPARVGERIMCLGGGLSERFVTSAGGAITVPDAVGSRQAAAMPINYGTTWFALHDRARLQSGETLLVTGAAGGTGTAAIQLGLAAGARVIAIAGGERKAQICADLGAHEVIDHRSTDDLVQRVRDLTDGKGVDVAYEPVGGDVSQQVRRMMAWDGRFLVIGFAGGDIPNLPANHILLKNYSVVGVHWGASLGRDPQSFNRQMVEVFALAEKGLVDPPLFDPVDFDGAAQALQDLADRKTWAKVVVDI